MSLQTKEEKILSILADAENWTEDDIKSNLKSCWPFITEFVDHTDDAQIATQVIRVSFSSFLPHVSLTSEADTLVNVFLSSILKSLTNLIDEVTTEGASRVADNLECILLCMESSKILLSYFIHEGCEDEKICFDHVEKVPNSVIKVLNLSLKHYKDRNKYYDSNVLEIEAILKSLVKEIAEGCSLACELISKLDWSSDNFDGLSSLSEVCENLSGMAHYLSEISELKMSLVSWKTFAMLIQTYSEDIKREIVLISTIEYLYDELLEGLQMIKSFEKNSPENLDSNEERIFDRVLKRSVFNLRIVVVICDKFQGFLRGTHSKLLRIILSVIRYSSHSLLIENLPENCKKKIDEQLTVGIYPLLSHIQNDKEFIQEVSMWMENNCSRSNPQPSEDHLPFLLFLISLIRQELSTPIKESGSQVSGSVMLQHILVLLPYCHVELNCPQMLPGVMFDCHAQTTVSLYTYTLMYTCAFVSVFNEAQFSEAEQILFENVLNLNPWNYLLASDVLCFISRYGSATLCESHCLVLMAILTENPSMDKAIRRNCLMVLARLLSFTAPGSVTNLLEQWISENPPREIVAELFTYLNVNRDAGLQTVADQYIFDSEQNLESGLDSFTKESMVEVVEYLESAGLYCRSSSVRIEDIKPETVSYLTKSLAFIFERFPAEYISSSMVSKLFVVCLHLVSLFAKFMSMDTVCEAYDICSQVSDSGRSSDILSIIRFMSSRNVGELNMGSITGRIIEIFVRLLSQQDDFLHLKSIQSLVSFAQHSKNDEVFSSVIDRLKTDERDNITQYLQYVPVKFSNLERTFLQQQSTHPSSREGPKIDFWIPINICSDVDEKNVNTGGETEGERAYKRKRVDQEMNNEEEEVIDKLEYVKSILKRKDLKIDTKHCIKNKLIEILELCDF